MRCYGLERIKRSPLSLVSAIRKLAGRNGSGSGLEIREYVRGDPLFWPRGTLYLQKLALTCPTIGGRSVDIVRSRTEATEFSLVFLLMNYILFRRAAWLEADQSLGCDLRTYKSMTTFVSQTKFVILPPHLQRKCYYSGIQNSASWTHLLLGSFDVKTKLLRSHNL
jgi:hypothetical protein